MIINDHQIPKATESSTFLFKTPKITISVFEMWKKKGFDLFDL